MNHSSTAKRAAADRVRTQITITLDSHSDAGFPTYYQLGIGQGLYMIGRKHADGSIDHKTFEYRLCNIDHIEHVEGFKELKF